VKRLVKEVDNSIRWLPRWLPSIPFFKKKSRPVRKATVMEMKKWIKNNLSYGYVLAEEIKNSTELAILINDRVKEERDACITLIEEQASYWSAEDEQGIRDGCALAVAVLSLREHE